jgi:3-keto-5-aminohexanoate cleavage enzyme
MKSAKGLAKGKLIVTVTLANPWIYPEANNYPQTLEEIAGMACRCCEEGASIAHIHAPKGACSRTIELIRERCDIIVQIGMSSEPLEERREVFEAKPDMMSIILNHHDEYFHQIEVNRLHPRNELEEYCKLCQETGIKPEFEVWHYGSIWNLNYLIERNLVGRPYFLTQFFDWPGGTWSPATPDEFFHRMRYLPPNCLCSTSVMGPKQNLILPLAIATGYHMRIGTEDYPYIKKGILAKDNAELVRKIVNISRGMGREVATPAEARKMIGIG